MSLLAVKLFSLKEELKVSKEILREASIEVDRMFQKKYFPEIPVENDAPPGPLAQSGLMPEFEKEGQNSEEISEKRTELEQNLIDPEVRALFRKIALEIHPDRLVSVQDGPEKDRKIKLFQKANSAMEDNDLIILANIAMTLGVDVPEISPERLKEAEKKIFAIKKELKEIESTYVWHWFFCTCPKKKNQILEKLFDLMYKKGN
jgi:hypothetical protein